MKKYFSFLMTIDNVSLFTLLLHVIGCRFVILRDEGKDDVESLPEHVSGALLLDAEETVAELDLDVPGAVHILHCVLVPGRSLEQIISVEWNYKRKVRHPRLLINHCFLKLHKITSKKEKNIYNAYAMHIIVNSILILTVDFAVD